MKIHNSPTSTSDIKLSCKVCHESADGLHFGAPACRACAAFFRRTVQLNKKHSCAKNSQCYILSNIRNMCRSCRYGKCLSVGMKTSAVQQKRDQLGKREALRNIQNSHDDAAETPKPEPVLDRIFQAYKQLEESRKTVHNRKDNQIPKAICWEQIKDLFANEMSIVYTFLCKSFPGYATCPPDAKRAMFKNFFLPFTLIESSYLSYINDKPDIMIMPSGDFIDLLNFESYYNGEYEKFTKDQASSIFHNQFGMMKNSITFPLMAEKVDIYEFLFLISMLLLETDAEIDAGSSEAALKSRNSLIRDLLYYYTSRKVQDDPALRLGKILTLLPSIHRYSRKFQEYLEIKSLLNIYTLPRNLYDMFTPTS
ncbi:unnamed protein product [Caenorhabditis angaria]|uniref:Uncharacterized protein n=1 Tax=Caenorhabditis angaria TaxID=860376 RepID=A0A9P1N9T3_9PELO|nr:unnamed protein product [Caenorhabditis angaria]